MLIRLLPESLKSGLKKIPFVQKVYQALFRIVVTYLNPDYKHWIKEIEPILWSETIHEKLFSISIVVPVYNPPIQFLRTCIESVLNQSYTHWQLILVNDASSCEKVNEYLNLISDAHDNITLIEHDVNQHISVTTNTGIKYCTGDYIALLDHDDLLAPQALNEVMQEIKSNPDVQWLYSDEDFINKKGRRISPHFKSDWNPYLLHAHNYITHFSIYKSTLLKELGGCRINFEGAQDYDLALRASEFVPPEQIKHITKILYHWRIHNGSTASNSEEKPYTVKAGREALIQHLQRKNISAEVSDGNLDNYYHVSYIPEKWPKVSIVIPTRDHKSVLETCVVSILAKTDYADFELVIMNNQTKEADALAYLDELEQDARVSVFSHDKDFNYSEINNRAVELANGEVIVLLNNDTEVINQAWLKELVGLAMQPDVGCVGAKLLYADNSIQHAGIVMGLGGYAAHSHRCIKNAIPGYYNRPHVNQVMSGVTGACLAIRKKLYLDVGGLDEIFTVAYNDVDFCMKVMSAGYYNVYCANAELYHYESKTRGDDAESEEKIQRFDNEKKILLERWPTTINNDPYYSPHLTRNAENFAIRLHY